MCSPHFDSLSALYHLPFHLARKRHCPLPSRGFTDPKSTEQAPFSLSSVLSPTSAQDPRRDLEYRLLLMASQPSTTTAFSSRLKDPLSAVVKQFQVGSSIGKLPQQMSELCMGANRGTALEPNVYGAAAGDLSPSLSAGLCEGSQNTTAPQYDMSQWCVTPGSHRSRPFILDDSFLLSTAPWREVKPQMPLDIWVLLVNMQNVTP